MYLRLRHMWLPVVAPYDFRREALLTQGDFIDGAISGYNNPGNAILKFITQIRYGHGQYPSNDTLLTQQPVFQRGPHRYSARRTL